ncbi:Phosphatidylglycerol/phosphatidylinositol transfer protein [Turnera subulata]|uniref:Phosphatidylglycerol/phosphatidylinositol transfer protein n=1 Tax=Turnera subulata TaxID=218843 RepID=A0A9Q0FW04_9ROSI|nr:Phosphatidylglycerol/phosphatidylinositol transfer protein [Turnera subulata]
MQPKMSITGRKPPSPAATTATFLFLLLMVLLHGQTHASPIKTIVVLVMENRSFDHMLGWMKKLNPEINGVDGTESNLLNVSDPRSQKFTFNNQAQYVDPDPGHSFQAIREQIFGSSDISKDPPPMDGFAQQAFSMDPSMNMSRDVMNGFNPDSVAVYKTLVSEFAVFDRWFASVPSSTQPNRLFVHSGTSAGATSNIPALLAKGYPQRTIFENLEDAGISWGIYYQNIPATLFYRNLRKLKYISKFHPYGSFKKDARSGKLPRYVVVEQRYMDLKIAPANDDHPSHDVYQGQMFVKDVYETLRASPQWNETLFVITYDEHGGFYDHVPTPVHGVPSPDGIVGPEPFLFKFDRLGVRVPTIVISPWIEKGTVVHGPKGSPFPTSEYEHSSIPATVKKLYNLTSFLTKRDEWAGTFEAVVQTRTQPRTDCPMQLPTPTQIRRTEAKEEAQLTEFQQELVQLAAVLRGDNILTSYPRRIGKKMTVREGNDYMEDAVKRFLEAGAFAKKMGVDEEQIVQMRPSLTTRRSRKPVTNHP